ncbi:MAG: GGDEF domain-containing protein, partial [Burkholderiaceae bacterium]
CRLGGDEFVVLLDQAVVEDDALQVACKIIASLSEPIVGGTDPLRVGASVGIAMTPHDGDELDGLLRSADEAMYLAKQAGRGTCRLRSLSVRAQQDAASA